MLLGRELCSLCPAFLPEPVLLLLDAAAVSAMGQPRRRGVQETCMLFLPWRLCLTWGKVSAALMDEEQGNQLLGRRSPIKEETTVSLQ